MSNEVVRLTADESKALSEALNYAFKGDKDCKHFEKQQPKMWSNDEKYMPCHLAIKENGKIIAVLGVYPYPVKIGKTELLFATVGNVATLPEARGKGCMKTLLIAADKEMHEKGIHAARLAGLRTRYERCGFEPCGNIYRVIVTKRNVSEAFGEISGYTFKKIEQDDFDALRFAQRCYESDDFCVLRGSERDMYLTLNSWNCHAYIVYKNGEPVGYIATSGDDKMIAEHGALSNKLRLEVVAAYIANGAEQQYDVPVHPFPNEFSKTLLKICENYTVNIPTQFKIVNWQAVTSALLGKKAEAVVLPQGSAVIGIEKWGNLKIEVNETSVTCEKTDEACDFTVDELAAARLLFGPAACGFAAEIPAEKSVFLSSLLPLPLSWNPLDSL